MAKKNKVIAGDYEGKDIIHAGGKVTIATGWFKTYDVSKESVKEYEIIDEESRKSATSAVGRAFVGGVILGPVGWLAGLTAKSKSTHVLAVEFNDGKKSLIEVDKKAFATLTKILF
ncbi:hypothetical protein [Sporosarcina sp. P17b]|uniref:hypothetical protein n=1 Tax=Sporosarcina sp. P17b TaxID=2048260 RepID=UPI000C171231|nr:hypothetical protein [Sporosarcina sp. P17b]PIC71018.1 hypothetical protein CSV76_16755 [Sporosarcina sp. P17b]